MAGSGEGAITAEMVQAAQRIADALVYKAAPYISKTHHEFPHEIRNTLKRFQHEGERLAPEIDRVGPDVHTDRDTAVRGVVAASEDGGREVAAAGRHLTEASATRIDPASSPSIHAARTSLDVTQLADHAAGMDLPFNVNTACGSRAYGILSEFRRLGVPPEELGIAHSVIPDASAAGLERAYATGQIMYNPARLTPSFSERLRANIGQVITPGETVEFEGARFRRTRVCGDGRCGRLVRRVVSSRRPRRRAARG